MKISDNFSVSNLFISKTVRVHVDESYFTIALKVLKDYYSDTEWGTTFHWWTTDADQIKGMYVNQLKENLDRITMILFDLGAYSQFRYIYQLFNKYLYEVLPELEINTQSKTLSVNGIPMTPEIWDYVLYILKLSCGMKVVKPPTFNTEEERQWYLAQKANEDRIAKIRANNVDHSDREGLGKMLLSITYTFPSFTFDYLINQTMAQIQWLQKYAAGAVSYEVNAQAMAAGNMKKGKKLEFFIK